MSSSPAVRDTNAARRASALVVVLTAIGSLAACGPGDDEPAAERVSCRDAVTEAADAAEVADTVRLLDDAMLACRSFAALAAELERHPGVIGYDPATFVELRCAKVDDEAVASSPSCTGVASPASTVPDTTIADVVFVGETLDGRQIEIRPSAEVEFVGGVPSVVQQTVDIAFEAGCEGVLTQRDEWAGRVDDPEIGDIASVYAQHAQNVARYVGCEPGEVPVPAEDGDGDEAG